MRTTEPTGKTAGSAAITPLRVLAPDCVLPARQYAVAVTRSVAAPGGRERPGRWAAAGPMSATIVISATASFRTRNRRDQSACRRPAAQPPEEDNHEKSGDERAPPGAQSERAQRGGPAL